MKIVNKALLKVAGEIAREYGYIKTKHEVENLVRSKFWGTSYYAAKTFVETKEFPTFESVRYIYPVFDYEQDAGKSVPKIELDVRFKNPRICVRYPDGGFVSVEYSTDSYEFSEAQIFGESGYQKLPALKQRIEELISIYSNETELKDKIRNCYKECAGKGIEPTYAHCQVSMLDDGSTFETVIKMDNGEDDNDDLIFFYATGLNDLLSLTEKSGEDFVISDFFNFSNTL